MNVICEKEISLEKCISEIMLLRDDKAVKPIVSLENINRLKAIQEIIFLEEGKALTHDEVIGLVLNSFEKSIKIDR
jgi:hypothetical protein